MIETTQIRSIGIPAGEKSTVLVDWIDGSNDKYGFTSERRATEEWERVKSYIAPMTAFPTGNSKTSGITIEEDLA